MADEKKGMSLPILLGVIILVIIMAAGTSFLMVYLFGRAQANNPVDGTSSKNETKQVQETKPGSPYAMGQPFIVNLLDSRRYLKIGVVLEVEQSEKEKINEEIATELDDRNAKLRDAINEILRAQSQEDLADPSLRSLKSQIVVKLNQILTKGKIKDVWFTDIQIQ